MAAAILAWLVPAMAAEAAHQKGATPKPTQLAAFVGPRRALLAASTKSVSLPANIDMNFATNTYIGCSIASCLNLVRASSETCDGGTSGVTYVGDNVWCRWGSTYPASTNLEIQSNLAASWSANYATLTAAAATSPDGTSDAATIVESSGVSATQHYVTSVITKTAAIQTYAISAYIKSNGRYPAIALSDSAYTGGVVIYFDTVTGGNVTYQDTYGGTGWSTSNPVISESSSGFYRISFLVVTDNSATLRTIVETAYAVSTGANNYTGDGVSGMAVFCVQAELVTGTEVTQATPCMPTTTVAASRAADDATLIGAAAAAAAGPNASVQVATVGVPNGVAATMLDVGGTVLLGKTSADLITTAVGAALTSSVSTNWVASTISALSWMPTGGTLNLNDRFATSDAAARNPSGTFHLGSTSGSSAFLSANISRLTISTPAVTYPTYTGVAYYVSPTGSDSNNGTSSVTPWQTTTKVNAGTYYGNDSINMLGDLAGCIVLNPGNSTFMSPINPVTINGGGHTLTANCPGDNSAAVIFSDVHANINNCVIRAGATAEWYGVYHNVTGTKGFTQTVENCDIGGFYAGTAGFGGEIFTAPYSSGILTVNTINNTLHGLIGPTSPDDNGVAGYPYIGASVAITVTGNIAYNMGGLPGSSNAGGHGSPFLISGGLNSTASYNLGHDSSANNNSCGGSSGYEFNTLNNYVVKFSEIYNMTTSGSCDSDGYDFDIGSSNSIGEYLYSHNNAGAGYLMYTGSGGGQNFDNNTFRYSISDSDVNHGNNMGSVNFQNDYGRHYIYNMTVWSNSAALSNQRQAPFEICCNANAMTGLIANNIFVQTAINDLGNSRLVGVNSTGPLPVGLLFYSNDWYYPSGSPGWLTQNGSNLSTFAAWQAAAPGGDTGATIASPGLISGGMGVTLTWTPSTQTGSLPGPSAYDTASAAMKSAGTDITGTTPVGAQDYYGTAIPGTGPCYNIGAYGVCP